MFIAQRQELYDIVEPFVRSMSRDDMIFTSEIRRREKLKRDKTELEQNIMGRMMAHLRKRARFDDPRLGFVPAGSMEQVTVIGRMFDQFPMDPAEFPYRDILGMKGIRRSANELNYTAMEITMKLTHFCSILRSAASRILSHG